MRKLQEIIDLVMDGGKPSYDELRYSLCVIDGLMALDGRSILRLAEDSNGARGKGISNIAMIIQRERFDRVKIALNSNPKEYLGLNNDPDNRDFVDRRREASRLIERICGEFSEGVKR